MNEYNLHTISIAEIRNATFMSLLYKKPLNSETLRSLA